MQIVVSKTDGITDKQQTHAKIIIHCGTYGAWACIDLSVLSSGVLPTDRYYSDILTKLIEGGALLKTNN